MKRKGTSGATSRCESTVFDPDLDPDGRYARLLVDVLSEGLHELGTLTPRT
ncbi:hypothetical protein [Microbacterium sp. Ag1]|uniref:hypothetical protein n=1 Tax=Microbacterium sp. Ag1 TaxID=1643443 RepID=UPI001E514C20|nr:hypothetical protein [Microbacterium sp. Ag1]